MSSSAIMEDDVNFLHWADCGTRSVGPQEHTPCHVDKLITYLCSMSSMDTFTQILTLLYRLFISAPDNYTMRCDRHVHTIASGMFTAPGLNRTCRASYNDPGAV